MWLTEDGELNTTSGSGEAPDRRFMVLDESITVLVRVPQEATSGEIRVALDCREVEGNGRTWDYVRMATWEAVGGPERGGSESLPDTA